MDLTNQHKCLLSLNYVTCLTTNILCLKERHHHTPGDVSGYIGPLGDVRICQGVVRGTRGNHQRISGCFKVEMGYSEYFGVIREAWIYLSRCQAIAMGSLLTWVAIHTKNPKHIEGTGPASCG